jgi:hypothetical protein
MCTANHCSSVGIATDYGLDGPGIELLLYSRLVRVKEREGAFTNFLMKRWKIDGKIANPPSATDLPSALSHLYHYAIDMAYIPPIDASETMQAFKQRISKVFLIMDNNTIVSPTVRIVRKHPDMP